MHISQFIYNKNENTYTNTHMQTYTNDSQSLFITCNAVATVFEVRTHKDERTS